MSSGTGHLPASELAMRCFSQLSKLPSGAWRSAFQQPPTPEQLVEARETAKDFFEALGKGDWNQVAGLCQPGFALGEQLDNQVKTQLNGLEVVSLGEPFRKGGYPGVYVPYEIRLKSGETKKFQLAVRRDNPEQKWYFDGGL